MISDYLIFFLQIFFFFTDLAEGQGEEQEH